MYIWVGHSCACRANSDKGFILSLAMASSCRRPHGQEFANVSFQSGNMKYWIWLAATVDYTATMPGVAEDCWRKFWRDFSYLYYALIDKGSTLIAVIIRQWIPSLTCHPHPYCREDLVKLVYTGFEVGCESQNLMHVLILWGWTYTRIFTKFVVIATCKPYYTLLTQHSLFVL